MPPVLIPGATRGLGLEFARQYAADGWRVVACCRAPDTATALRELAQASSGGALTLHALDVTDGDGIKALAKDRNPQAKKALRDEGHPPAH